MTARKVKDKASAAEQHSTPKEVEKEKTLIEDKEDVTLVECIQEIVDILDPLHASDQKQILLGVSIVLGHYMFALGSLQTDLANLTEGT